MNYFDFYEIPVSFYPDQDLVKRKFYALSKTYHPDFYINESQEKQEEILHLSTLNNKAYQTLSNSDKLLPYVLEMNGELVEGEKYTLPQNFLMDMMEVNEALMELEFDASEEQIAEATQKVNFLEEELNADLATHTQGFESAVEAEKNQRLKQIKDIWYRKKYLLRIRESINKFATR